LDKNKLLYINKNPKILEESLRSPFSLLKPRLLEVCAKYALKAICLNTYPYCSSSSKPKPIRLCKEDCEVLESTVCESDFRVARDFDYLAVILPNCTSLPPKGSAEAKGCVKLGISELGTVCTSYCVYKYIKKEIFHFVESLLITHTIILNTSDTQCTSHEVKA